MNARDELKRKPKWGLDYCRAAENEWFGSDIFVHHLSPSKLVEKIRYSIGSQSVERYRKWLGADEKIEANDRSLMNIDYRPPDYVKKILEALHGAIFSQPFNTYLEAIDPMSKSTRLEKAFRAMTHRDLMLSEFGKELQAMFGPDLIPADLQNVPMMEGDQGDEMMQAFLDQSNKLPVEIAPKTILDKVLLVDNKWQQQHRKIGYDIFSTNLPTAVWKYQKGKAICKRISPVHGVYDPSTQGDFQDSRHYGYRELVTPQDLRDRYGLDALTKEQWRKVDQMAETSYRGYDLGNSSWVPFYLMENLQSWNRRTGKLEIINFWVKVPMGRAYTEDEDGFRFMDEWEDKKNPEVKETGKMHYMTVFRGCHIVSADLMIEWKEDDYILRRDFNPEKPETMYRNCELPVAIYTEDSLGFVKSLVDSVMSHIDTICKLEFKREHWMMKAVPPRVAINMRAISRIPYTANGPEGGTRKYSPMDIVKMGQQMGVMFYVPDEYGRGQTPIEHLPSTWPAAELADMMNQIVNELQMMREATGITQALDGGDSGKTFDLVGVERMKLNAASNAVRHIYACLEHFSENLYEKGIMLLQAMAREGELDQFIESVGIAKLQVMTGIKDLPLASLGVRAEFFDKQSYEMEYREMYQTAITQNQINIAQKAKLSNIDDPKERTILLAYYVEKNLKEQHQQQMELAQASDQVQAQSAMQLAQMNHQQAMEFAAMENQLMQDTNAHKAQLDMMLKNMEINLKNQGSERVEQVRGDNQKEVQEMKGEQKEMELDKKAYIERVKETKD